jgi:hypothetical protein
VWTEGPKRAECCSTVDTHGSVVAHGCKSKTRKWHWWCPMG